MSGATGVRSASRPGGRRGRAASAGAPPRFINRAPVRSLSRRHLSLVPTPWISAAAYGRQIVGMVTSRTHPRPGAGAPPVVDFYVRALLGIASPIELAFDFPLRRTSGLARRRPLVQERRTRRMGWTADGFRGVAFAC